jgi:putative ATP-binding cassette transporter
MVALAVLTSLASGASSAGLIALINAALMCERTSPTPWVWGFVALGAIRLATHGLSRSLLNRLSQQTVAKLRQDFCQKILAAPLRHLEELGLSRLLTVLTDDMVVVVNALPYVPTLAVHLAVLVGCSVYLTWLSRPVLFCTLAFIALGLLSYKILQVGAYRALRLARQEQETLFCLFRALTEGIKELKLHRARRDVFLNQEIHASLQSLQQHSMIAEGRFILFDVWTQLMFYTLLGLTVFALPAVEDIGTNSLVSFVLTLIYMMRPVVAVMNILPLLGRARVALEKVEGMSRSLATLSRETWSGALARKAPSWGCLRLEGVAYRYKQKEENHPFTVGPIDLSFRPGELVFLIGGNGSGKSTLAKVLTGLYPSSTGAILLDGQPVTDENRERYRQLFAAVFTDFYLFDTLPAASAADLEAKAQGYLHQFQLGHKVRILNGAFSTTALSHGQRKRLALLSAYLEDRPFYVFDEWAANQDPEFKEVFYTQLLQELKARNKTALVISHDDRYYHVADRLVRLEEGQLYELCKRIPRPDSARVQPCHPLM